MKKPIFIFILILVGGFVLLSMIDTKSDYSAEKFIWKINKEFSEVTKDPKTVPDITFDQIAHKYEVFIKKYPDSNLTSGAHILRGRVFMFKKDYEKAREVFEEVRKNYVDKPAIGAQALAETGRTYALEGDTENVLNTYKTMLNDYPLTNLGLETPLRIAQFHAQHKNVEQAAIAFKAAIIHYKKLISENPNSPVEFNALRLIASCYMAQHRWEEAVNIFGEVLIKFPQKEYLNPRSAQTILKSINSLSVLKLNNFDIPLGIYKEFIEKNPRHKLNPSLEKMIQSLELLKAKKISVSDTPSVTSLELEDPDTNNDQTSNK
jgi:tetratricopeptide (TPR) repeat protein